MTKRNIASKMKLLCREKLLPLLLFVEVKAVVEELVLFVIHSADVDEGTIVEDPVVFASHSVDVDGEIVMEEFVTFFIHST